MKARMWRLAGAAAFLGMIIVAACSANGEPASVETTLREYLRAVWEGDAELFCRRIDPQLGFFSDEENCLEVMIHQADPMVMGSLAPRFRGQHLSDITGRLLALEDMEVRGDEAVAVATISWTGEGPDGFAELGDAELAVRLTRAEGEWRIAAFSHAPGPPRDDEEAEAVTMAVRDYYEAMKEGGRAGVLRRCELTALAASGMASIDECRERGGRLPEWPHSIGEFRSSSVLGRIVDVEIEGDFAVAIRDTHTIGNGALSHPVLGGRVLLAREDGRWGYVRDRRHEHEAWALFE